MHFYVTINNNIHNLKISLNGNKTISCKDYGNQSWILLNELIKLSSFLTLVLPPLGR